MQRNMQKWGAWIGELSKTGNFNVLLRLRPSPIVALNRAIALAQVRGPEAGLAALDEISDRGRLASYPFFETAAGGFHRLAGRPDEARAHFERALELARNPAEVEV